MVIAFSGVSVTAAAVVVGASLVGAIGDDDTKAAVLVDEAEVLWKAGGDGAKPKTDDPILAANTIPTTANKEFMVIIRGWPFCCC